MNYCKFRKVLKFDGAIVAREYWYPVILTDEELKAHQEPKVYTWEQTEEIEGYWAGPFYNELSPIDGFYRKRKGKMFFDSSRHAHRQWENPNGLFTVIGEVKEATPTLHDLMRYPRGDRALELIVEMTREIVAKKI